MSGFEPPSSLSSVEALLERKRAANELSELELHLLLKAESLNREKEELRKKLEASELEIERLVALLDTWVGPSPGHGTTSKKRMSDAEPKPSGFRFLGIHFWILTPESGTQRPVIFDMEFEGGKTCAATEGFFL